AALRLLLLLLLLRHRSDADRRKLLIERRQHFGGHIDRTIVRNGAVLRHHDRGAPASTHLLDNRDELAANLLLSVRQRRIQRALGTRQLLLGAALLGLESADLLLERSVCVLALRNRVNRSLDRLALGL